MDGHAQKLAGSSSVALAPSNGQPSSATVVCADPPSPGPSGSAHNGPGWRLASPSPPSTSVRKKSVEPQTQEAALTRISISLRELRLFFSATEGGKGYDPTTMFGTHAPTNEELTDFLTATSPRTAEDILAHFYGESPQLVEVLGNRQVGASAEDNEEVNSNRKVKRRSSFKKDNEDVNEDLLDTSSDKKRPSITWADQVSQDTKNRVYIITTH